MNGVKGRLGQLSLALFAALAPVGVVDRVTLQVEVANLEAQHLAASSAGQGQDDGSVPQPHRCVRDNGEQLLDVDSSQASGWRWGGLGALKLVAGVASNQPHADEEPVEGAQAGDASGDGD